MRSRHLLWAGVGAVDAAGVLGGEWMLSLAPVRDFTSPPPIANAETEALLSALKPPTRRRLVVAAIGINDVTETTDYPDFVEMQLEYPAESRRAVRDRANAFDQAAMTRTLR